jgi:UDP-glucose 4-epimerase
VSLVAGLVRRAGLVDYSPEQMHFLNFGRVVDSTKLRTAFGYAPRYTTPQAYDSFLAGRPVLPVVPAERIRDAERLLGMGVDVLGAVTSALPFGKARARPTSIGAA